MQKDTKKGIWLRLDGGFTHYGRIATYNPIDQSKNIYRIIYQQFYVVNYSRRTYPYYLAHRTCSIDIEIPLGNVDEWLNEKAEFFHLLYNEKLCNYNFDLCWKSMNECKDYLKMTFCFPEEMADSMWPVYG